MKIVLTIAFLTVAGAASALTTTFDAYGGLAVASERGSGSLRLFFDRRENALNRNENRRDRNIRDRERAGAAWQSDQREQENRRSRISREFKEKGLIEKNGSKPVVDYCELWCNEGKGKESDGQPEVSAVPLPPSGFLLIGVLAGLFGFAYSREARTA